MPYNRKCRKNKYHCYGKSLNGSRRLKISQDEKIFAIILYTCIVLYIIGAIYLWYKS